MMDFNAKTTTEDILNLKKSEIQEFLRKHNAKISGSKQELALRAFDTNQNLFTQEECPANHCFDTTASEEASEGGREIPDYKEILSGWTSDLEHLPHISHKDLESYLLHSSHRTNDKQKMNCYRQYVRGFNFYKEGYIHSLMINKVNENYVFIRSKCFPSMKKGTYSQWILCRVGLDLSLMDKSQIRKAGCTCPAGLGEGCTHVAGLLFAMEDTHKRQEEIPVTSKPCQWNKPSKRKRTNDTVDNMTFKKFKYGKHSYDEKKAEKKYAIIDNDSFFKSLTGKLAKNATNYALLHLVEPEPDHVAVESDLNVGFHEVVTTSKHIYYKTQQPVINFDQYVNLTPSGKTKDEFIDFVSHTPSHVINEIEVSTRGQSNNARWFACRKGRITATVFHDTINRRKSTTSNKLVNRIIGSETNDINTASISWGNKFEIVAQKKFITLNKLQGNKNIEIQDVGIFLLKDHAYIGASPDGIIKSADKRELIEIKCPYKWRKDTVGDACRSKDFYCFVENNEYKLKSSHRYYTQIQGQMMVTNIHSCKLVIFTLKDLIVIPVKYDAKFCSDMLKKLQVFYKENIIPALYI